MDPEFEAFIKPFNEFMSVSNSESDRGKVLVAASQVDLMLGEILKGFLLDCKQSSALFKGPNAPLSSLFNKTNAARALGLISDSECKAIDSLRGIRNLFAHQVNVSFKNDNVRQECLRLSFGIQLLIDANDHVIEDPRTRFQMTTTSLITSLYNRAHYAKKARLQEKKFPQ